MYRDKGFKKTNEVKLRFSDTENELINAAMEIDGGVRAVLLRELAVNWARNLIESSRRVNTKTPLGVVDKGGEILFKFAA